MALANHTLLIARDGTERPIADSGAPVCDPQGQVTGVVVVFRDQTEARAAEQALRESEERFRTFFDDAPIGKSMTQPNGQLTRVNRAFCEMVGYSAEELARMTFVAITHPDDLPESRECVRSLLAGEQDAWSMEKRYLAKDGRIIWAHITTRLHRDAQGRPRHLLTHVQDITERLRAEAAARALATRQEAILAAVPDIIMQVDADKRYTWANRAGLEFFGEDVIGKEAAEYFEGEQDTYGQVQPLFDGEEQTIYLESWQRRQDGKTRLLAWWCRVLKDARGTVQGALSTARDITEIRRAEQQVLDLNAELEQRVTDRTARLEAMNRELEAFCYTVSHDLRAPLRAIDGFSHVLAEDHGPRLGAEGERTCAVIAENARTMSQLIDDLLRFSRLGRSGFDPVRTDMGLMARSVFLELTREHERARIDFQVRDLPPAVGDAALLRQVWANLLGNAVKFTSRRDRGDRVGR